MILNPILSTDSYKFSHFMQYPPGTSLIKSYITPRGTKVPGVTAVVTAGAQLFARQFLSRRITKANIDSAERFCAKHGTPFNRKGFEIIVAEHDGYWPVTLRGVAEGTPIPFGELMYSIENNDDRLPWVTSYLESLFLSYVWGMSTVATKSREMKRAIYGALEFSSDNPADELLFKLHDFGLRGAMPGAAGAAGLAHLYNFLGTDTAPAIEYAMEYFDSDVCGYSISASEHSTMTAWGREREYEAYDNMVKQYAKPGAIFACVIDSYDTMNAIRLWALPQQGNKSLLDQVKEAGAKVVLRPDSGDAVKMPIQVTLELMHLLKDECYINTKGFNVLPDHVRVIQGDGIGDQEVREILFRLAMDHNVSASCIGFGMGGGLLQKQDRDMFKFAMKACYAVINGESVDVVKDPITDPGKKSKSGDLALLKNKATGELKTFDLNTMKKGWQAEWQRVDNIIWSHAGNRTIFNSITIEQIRANAAI
jgi:nicotinamide phosphoribosyltransferase